MIPQEIRDELEQTIRWWDREFAKLLRAAFEPRPFVEAEHADHRLIEEHYFARPPVVLCVECPIVWVPRGGGVRG